MIKSHDEPPDEDQIECTHCGNLFYPEDLCWDICEACRELDYEDSDGMED